MKVVSLFFPGNFEDAFLYMGSLLVFTAERSLRFHNIERIVSALEERLPDLRPLPTFLFTRNDWLASTQFGDLMRNEIIARAVRSTIDNMAEYPFIEIPHEAQYVQSEQQLNIPAHVLLDIELYNRRLYLGADTGLYHIDYDWSGDGPEREDDPTKRLDARCICLTARLGALNVSCGDQGLFSAFDEFHWSHNGFVRDIHQVADKSLRTAWFGDDLVNYPRASAPSLLKGMHQTVDVEGFERERRILVDFEEEKENLDYLFEGLGTQEAPVPVRYAYNSNNTFFVQTEDGDFATVGTRRDRGDEPAAQFARSYAGTGGRILSAHFVAPGLVLETDDQVLAFVNGEVMPIVSSEVLSVRSFMRSKRYRNLVTITKEDGILLTSLFE